jgi:DNA polymerase-3 subunit gamma/tau
MQTLYRKYRAVDFEQIIGQDHVVRIIKQSIKENRISHAYLFTGPRGTGKTSLARLLAKVINCKNVSKSGEPCNECSNCISINKGNFLDLIEIDAASNRGIEEIRDLKEKINFLPVEGKNKVYIIDEVHMLTSEAFNALLKTLEEPPSNVVFILATTEPHKLPLTIISRTQRFDFKQADEKSLYKKLKYIIELEKFSLSDEAISLLVHAGQGSFRDAETVLEKVLSSFQAEKEISREDIEKTLGFVSKDLIRDFLSNILKDDLNTSLEILHNIWEDGMSLTQFTKEVLDEAREQLLDSVKGSGSHTKIDGRKMIIIIKEFNTALNDMRNNLLNILPLEIALFNIIGFDSRQIIDSKVVTNQISDIQIKKVIPKINTEVKTLVNKIGKEDKPKVSISTIENQFRLITDKWTEILVKAKEFNHFLTAILTGAKLELIDGEIILKVTSPFHKKRIDNAETKKILLKIISELTGESIDFQCIIYRENSTIKSSTNNEKIVEEIFN